MSTYTRFVNLPRVSIVIPTRNQFKLLAQCLESLMKLTNYPQELLDIIIVNNQSSESNALCYLAELSTQEAFTVMEYDSSFNFSSMNNLAVSVARGEFICLLNNDIEIISPNWLMEMVYFAKRDDIACVGAKLYYPNDTIQHAGVVLGINGVAGHVYKHCPRSSRGHNGSLLYARYYSAVTAACMLVKKTLYKKVGGFDEKLAVAYNDVDFCLQLGQLGYRHVWTPKAELYHHESISRGNHKKRTWMERRRYKREVKYMKQKWGDVLLSDPTWDKSLPLTETWCGE